MLPDSLCCTYLWHGMLIEDLAPSGSILLLSLSAFYVESLREAGDFISVRQYNKNIFSDSRADTDHLKKPREPVQKLLKQILDNSRVMSKL